MLAGWHWESSAHFGVDVERYGTTRVQYRYNSDVEVYYGIKGPEQGLGVQWRFEAEWDWLRLGALLGYTALLYDETLYGWAAHPDVGPTVSDRTRAMFYVGVPFKLDLGEPLPELDPVCLMKQGIAACQEVKGR